VGRGGDEGGLVMLSVRSEYDEFASRVSQTLRQWIRNYVWGGFDHNVNGSDGRLRAGKRRSNYCIWQETNVCL